MKKTTPTLKTYTWQHALIVASIATAFLGAVEWAKAAGIMSVRNDFAPFIGPALVGIVLALGNRGYLSKFSFLLLPILLPLIWGMSFTGVLLAAKLGVQRSEIWWFNLLIEQAPTILAGLWLQRTYARLTGHQRIGWQLAYTLLVIGFSFALYAEVDALLILHLIYFFGLTFLFSGLHIGQQKSSS
jgi:hypothetical protein